MAGQKSNVLHLYLWSHPVRWNSRLYLLQWYCGSLQIFPRNREVGGLLTDNCPCPNGHTSSIHKPKIPRHFNFNIFYTHFTGDFFSLQSELHGRYTSAIFSLCVHPVFKNIFKFRPSALMTANNFCFLLALIQFFMLPSSTSHHWFINARVTCSSSISLLDG